MTGSGDAMKALATVRAQRGYLLPHHGLLAMLAPELLEAYDHAYAAITLHRRSLGDFEREFVWLGILVSTEESIATHHLKKFRDAGGGDDDIALAVILAGYARSSDAFAFAEAHWQRHVPGFTRSDVYRAGLARLWPVGSHRAGLREMFMATAQTCRGAWSEVALHIKGALAEGVEEVELAEALSLSMFPGSVPNFVKACGVWQNLVLHGAVPASPALQAWASIDQSGFQP